MAKRRGNPNWGKPEPIGPVVPTVTSFEQVVKEFKLTPDQYIRSLPPPFRGGKFAFGVEIWCEVLSDGT